MKMTNIRGRGQKFPRKIRPSDSDGLHECFDCEGCICEDLCRKYEEIDMRQRIITLKEGDK